MTVRYVVIPFALTARLLSSTLGMAQAPPEPPRFYTGNLGGGFAITSGNTDTRNFNLSAEAMRDPKTKNVIKGNVSYLRGTQNDILSLDRTIVKIRDEYTLSKRTFAFGEVEYLRDQFKQIVFLWVPAGGIGYKIINTNSTQLAIDGSAGGLLEKNPGRPPSKAGSLIAGQHVQYKVSSAAVLTEAFSTIWKTKDFSDSLTDFTAGLTCALVGNLELKVEFIDSYKNKPSNPSLKKNDTALVTSFVWKF